MRLLFLSNEFPHAGEPTKATFNYDLLAAMAQNHDVTVVSPVAWWDEWKARWRTPGYVRLPERMTVHHPRFYYPPGCLRSSYGSFLWWSVRKTLNQLRQHQAWDGVLSYWAHPDGEVAVRFARQLGIPSVVMVGGSDVLLMTREPSRRACVQRALQQADAVVAVSRDLADKVCGLGVEPARVHVLRRGVDEHSFYAGDQAAARWQLALPLDRRLILWVGRMVSVKGLDVLVAACDLLRQSRRDFQLLLVGDGPLRESLQAEVRRRGLYDHIRFLGSVPHAELGTWFRAADRTVLPSRSEGIPNVLLESLACGTPYVASDVGGIPEISNHAAARLVPPEQPAALAAALAESLADTAGVPAHARPHTTTDFAAQMADLFESLRQTAGRAVPRAVAPSAEQATERMAAHFAAHC